MNIQTSKLLYYQTLLGDITDIERQVIAALEFALRTNIALGASAITLCVETDGRFGYKNTDGNVVYPQEMKITGVKYPIRLKGFIKEILQELGYTVMPVPRFDQLINVSGWAIY